MKVLLFIPCYVEQLYPQTVWNAVALLEKYNCEVYYNEKMTCCGQPAYNTGFATEAAALGVHFVEQIAIEKFDYVVTLGGSCAGYLKNHCTNLLRNRESISIALKAINKKMYDITDFLIEILNVENVGAAWKGKVAYHDACGALRECNIKTSPRKLLQNVAGLELVEMREAETCCGFGGTFSVKFPDISTAMASVKVDSAKEVNADAIVSTDLSCLMHMSSYVEKQGIELQVLHIVDVLMKR